MSLLHQSLWERLVAYKVASFPFMNLRAFFLLRYPPGWGAYLPHTRAEQYSCKLFVRSPIRELKKGRPNRKESAERKMVQQIRDGLPIENDLCSDLTIAISYDLIHRGWGFPRRETAIAIGIAAAKVLNRRCPYGLPLSGAAIELIDTLHPAIYRHRSAFTKKILLNHRPRAIIDSGKKELPMIAEQVLKAGGKTPQDWQEQWLP